MKKILYLTFYFEPDLCACSFRNSPLAIELAKQARAKDIIVDVYTTLPNRYSTYSAEATEEHRKNNLFIKRIKIPTHKNGIIDQIKSFLFYFTQVQKFVHDKKYDLIFASSSRLFTAYLGYRIAKKKKVPLYLDIRDIFVDTIKDVFPNPTIKTVVLPFIKQIEKITFTHATHINIISGGFKDYFSNYNKVKYSNYGHGVDPEFINAAKIYTPKRSIEKTILYAGNIGEGQGLHNIIPAAAKKLGDNYKFKIIGDGGAKWKLMTVLKGISNVEVLPPVNRNSLIEEYNKADFLFIHLNNFEAFKKVLPSKIFELVVFQKPLIAGVSGYAKSFIENEISNSIVFNPCDDDAMVSSIINFQYDKAQSRVEFINKYQREKINSEMVKSIISYL